jgi:hypothetical protein
MKIDLLTGETFTPKRSNQKFASALNRIAYNNKKARESRKEIEYLEKPLYRNYKILREIMEDANQRCFHKQFLFGKGFNFKVYNNVEHYEGKNHYAVYNFIIVKADKTEEVKIVKIEKND